MVQIASLYDVAIMEARMNPLVFRLDLRWILDIIHIVISQLEFLVGLKLLGNYFLQMVIFDHLCHSCHHSCRFLLRISHLHLQELVRVRASSEPAPVAAAGAAAALLPHVAAPPQQARRVQVIQALPSTGSYCRVETFETNTCRSDLFFKSEVKHCSVTYGFIRLVGLNLRLTVQL